ncbi:hypothetical protein PISMIDRAFT_17669 [Pisolithus microcarpus 441]|uniref:Uncharacterized protein n=1 Tax=Pisolithus microcarpus 441 TaxID=765257 RepID=A0A0C9XN70_9AGAM|nr:hypothetical protein BKA83DRAFT_17669 [Pisolithus microcarpus]KIK13880.1 hypothetical protein PISMIDRAFT_17669 [Pisolithus microcarpus 441]
MSQGHAQRFIIQAALSSIHPKTTPGNWTRTAVMMVMKKSEMMAIYLMTLKQIDGVTSSTPNNIGVMTSGILCPVQ